MKDQREIIKGTAKVFDLERGTQGSPALPPPVGLYGGDSDEGVHLRDYWRAVRKRLWLVAGVVVIVTLLAAIYVARQPDVYVAQTRVQVDLESAGAGLSKSQSVIINNPTTDPTYFNTQLQILTSPGLLRRVVKTLDLEHNQAFLSPQSVRERSTWRGVLSVFGLGGSKTAAGQQQQGGSKDELPLTNSVAAPVSRDDLTAARRLAPFVGALQAGLKVEPVKETRTAGYIKDTRLIDVSFRHPDPQVAAKIVNAVADTFVLANLEKKTETNTSTGDFLAQRVAELQSKIITGEEQLSNYATSHQILSLTGDQNIVVDRLAGLNRQLLEAENERKMNEATYRAALDPRAANALAEGNKQTGDTQGRLDVLRQKRAQLGVKYEDTYPEVMEVDKQIAELERQLKASRGQATGTAVTNLETRYRQSLAREQSLRAALDKQRGETLTQNEAGINYRILQQEIETNKSLLDGLLQRSRENDVVLAGTPNNISVVDYALAPEAPVGPKRTQSISLAFLLSLAFGGGLALFLEYLNDTVRSSEDVENLLHLPALSVIPSAGGAARRLLTGAGGGALGRRGLLKSGVEHPELLLDADIRSPLAEAYRHLRTQVLLSRAGQHPRTLLVSSSLPGEGKTTTSINTALSLAQTGASVVVVDGDLRRPRLHRVFDQGNSRGLSTILSSEMSTEEMLDLVHHHEASNLYLLTSGPVSPSPAELLGSEQMRRLIARLEGMFDHVIIDSPPIVSFTDSVLLATMVDGVLLVVQGGKTSRALVRRSKQILQDVGARVLGVVLNNVTLHRDDYYYYQYYHSYYEPEAGTETLASGTRG
ncbi:MAG: polysaccharide biosynthesis tyrosine autokinase [Acidobacteria bacterium]|nr:polysaccharide biosynthesis tyrosine autokinase [Acidobacteriota bacterium]